MKFKLYLKIIIFLFSIITSIYLLKLYFGFNEWSPDRNLIFKIGFYSPAILSLLCLYFSIYVYILKIELVHNYRRQATTIIIVLSSSCVLLSLTPAFWAYFSSLNSEINYENVTKSYGVDDIDLDESGIAKNKYEAQDYYRKTKKLVNYFDEDGTESLYSPDETDWMFFQGRQMVEVLKLRQVLMIKSANNLFGITITSFILFLIFLAYLKRKRVNL